MLIHKYEKQIKQFMTEEKKANNKAQYLSGCYIVSRERHPNEFKLGLSTNLMERIIKQYKICMSKKTKECFIHYAVICPRDYENNKTYSAIMEKLLLAQIAKEDKESYSHEWFLNDNMDTVGEILNNIETASLSFSSLLSKTTTTTTTTTTPTTITTTTTTTITTTITPTTITTTIPTNITILLLITSLILLLLPQVLLLMTSYI